MALIELHDLSKTYRMGAGHVINALDHVTLEIQEGEFVAIVGPSGSGKSTLMHMLGFLDKPSTGEMIFDNERVSKISGRRRAMIRSEKIGFVFQAFNLLPRMSVLRNTMLPLAYARHGVRGGRKRAWEMLQNVGMKDRAKHRPTQLSGGQRQRVAIARALVNQPRLVLADEPTGNLDSQTAETIMELFSRLNSEGRTIVIVTHDMEVARWAKRQIRMRDGRVADAGALQSPHSTVPPGFEVTPAMAGPVIEAGGGEA